MTSWGDRPPDPSSQPKGSPGPRGAIPVVPAPAMPVRPAPGHQADPEAPPVAPPAWGQPPPTWGQPQPAWSQQPPPAWGQPAQPASGQQPPPAWGQQGQTHQAGEQGNGHRGLVEPPERNPFQVTPAQYYRDQGYAEALPASPQPLPVASSRSSYLPGRNSRSSTLGIISLVIVVAMLGVCLAVAQALGRAYATIYLTLGSLDIDRSQITNEMIAPAIAPASAVGFASTVGFIGFILGIVAAVSKRGRAWGVAAILLGLVAPVVWLSVVMAAVTPVLQVLR